MIGQSLSRFGVAVVLGLSAFGPLTRRAEAQATAGNWADALFAEHGHDFGPVPRGAVVRHHFVMTNRYNEPVTILDVRASCGCTTGRALAQTIAPGQPGIIEAQMDTRNFVGLKATVLTVTVASASGKQAEARLDVRSMILSDIVLNPGTLDFGAVTRGQTPRLVLTIDRMGASSWRAEQMRATKRLGAVVDAELREVSRSEQGVSYQLIVGLRPDAPAGPIREEIQIVTNDRESPVVPVLVTADIRGALTASPGLLTLPPSTSAEGVQGRYLIRGARPFAIRKIEGAGDGFAVAAAEPEGRKALHVVTLTFKPGESKAKGDVRRTFRVQTDLAGEPPLELHAAARVEP
jgi:hypothetical protein